MILKIKVINTKLLVNNYWKKLITELNKSILANSFSLRSRAHFTEYQCFRNQKAFSQVSKTNSELLLSKIQSQRGKNITRKNNRNLTRFQKLPGKKRKSNCFILWRKFWPCVKLIHSSKIQISSQEQLNSQQSS